MLPLPTGQYAVATGTLFRMLVLSLPVVFMDLLVPATVSSSILVTAKTDTEINGVVWTSGTNSAYT
jgi:hypothetical protein